MLRDDNSSHPGKIDVSLFAGIDTMHISSECVCVCVCEPACCVLRGCWRVGPQEGQILGHFGPCRIHIVSGI